MSERVMFIGIQRLWYSDVLEVAVDETNLVKILEGMTEIYNSHEDSFTFEQDDPETMDYVNELTRKTYCIDTTNDGEMRINFSMGQYDFKIRSELEGGTGNTSGKTYAYPTRKQTIEKAFICLTRTGNFIVLPRTRVVAKTDTQEQALCLGATATVMNPSDNALSCFYFILGEGISTATPMRLISATEIRLGSDGNIRKS